jgi:outer membrane protein OmpA-like peptidoglycan-associated protein
MYFLKRILLFILLLQVVVSAFGDSIINDTLHNESKPTIGNKGALFQPVIVYYQSGKYFPGEKDSMLIVKGISEMKNKSNISFVISAFTDPLGTDIYNQHLSDLRAEQVKKVLIGIGIPDSRINIKVLGESLSKNLVSKDYYKMRKVEIMPIIMMK